MMKSTSSPLLVATLSVALLGGIAGSASAQNGPQTLGPDAVPGATFLVDDDGDTVDDNPGDGICDDAAGACSLRAAVQEANETVGLVQINVMTGTYVLTIANASGDEDAAATGDLDITGSVNIDGLGATVDANGIDRAFEVLGSSETQIQNLTVTGGLVAGGQVVGETDPVSGSGGAIANGGELAISSSTIAGNRANGPGASGGALLNTGTLSVSSSTIENNSATRAGGGIESNGGITTLTDVTIRGNSTGSAPGNGGGFHITGPGNATITGGSISANTAAAEGGGLWNGSGTMSVNNVDVIGNIASGADADQGGGGLFATAGGTLNIDGSTIVGNIADGASGSGGGILNDKATLTIRDTSIEGNRSNRAGGGIESNVGENSLSGVTLNGNSTGPAPGNGGGMHITGPGNATIDGGTVSGNTASAEGGGLWNGSATMHVNDVDVIGNIASGADADQGGGGLFANAGGTLNVDRSSIVGNVADGPAGSGGGILNDQATLNVTNSTFDNNTSNRAGGGIESNVGETNLTQVRIRDNKTGSEVGNGGPGNGGGVHITGAGNATITASIVTANDAANEGGGLWNGAGTMIVTSTAIYANSSPVGAQVFNKAGTLIIDGVDKPIS